MRRKARVLAVLLVFSGGAAGLGAQPFPRQDVPPSLRPWVAWVLDEVPDHACPIRDGAAICLWPGRLRLDLTEKGGAFQQEAYADRAFELALPGDAQRWPQAVLLDGRPMPVVERSGAPTVRLSPGAHRLEGRFAWRQLPDSLPVPSRTAIVDLTVDGRPVPLPAREQGGLLWLRREGGRASAAGESLRLQVFRKVSDGIPLLVETRLELEVSGKAREVELRGVALEHSAALAVGGDLPAQLDAGGRLRVQVRSGKFRVSVLARLEGPKPPLAAPKAPAPWPEREIWVFEASPVLRQVEVSGASPVDPSRTDLPQEWRSFPAFALDSGGRLSLREVQRGEPQAAPDGIQLSREMWLDLSGEGLTVRDTFGGALSRTWRLDLAPPGELGRVAVGGQDQLVTTRAEGGPAGVELRQGALALVADSRLPRTGAALPAVGWSVSVERLQATLHLPPGWRVLAATGVDRAPGAWASRWTLLGFFFVLLVAFGVARLFDWRWGALALLAVGLSYHEPDAPFLSWLSLLGAAAVLKAEPKGRLAGFARTWWGASLLVLALLLVPFYRDQIRIGLFPQTEAAARTGAPGGLLGGVLGGITREAQVAKGVPAPAAPPATVAAPRSEEEAALSTEQAEKLKTLGYAAQRADQAQDEKAAGRVAQRAQKAAPAESKAPSYRDRFYAKSSSLEQDPHAVLQTGPGVPTWQWQSLPFSWSGPVSKDHRLRLVLLTPGANILLALLRIALLTLLGLRLTVLGRGGSPPAPALAMAALLLLALAVPARADEAGGEPPRREVLEELKRRLTRPEPCQPQCLTTASLALKGDGQQILFGAEVHAGARGAWAVPGPASSWVPAGVRVDGMAAAAVARLEDGFLHVRLEPGVHRVEAFGPLPPQDSLTLQLKDRPRRGTAELPGWEVVGLREDAPAEGSIQLSRKVRAAAGTAREAGPYSPWLEVARRLEIGVSWRVVTTVRRVSPLGAPVAVRIPLLKGESLTEGGWETEKGEVMLSLGRDQQGAEWASTLAVSPALDLGAPEGRPWSEVWRLRCGIVWECRAEGLPPVRHQRDAIYEPEFRPWPGETLKLSFERPAGAKGQTLTVDEVQIAATPGTRLETTTLLLRTRASREDSLALTLPKGVEVQEVKVGGQARPIRPEGDRLPLSLPAGAQTVELKWHRPGGLSPFYAAPRVGLSVPAVNASVAVTLPPDRWLLLAPGPAWGPAVLFWGYLLFVLLVAALLARLPGSPLTEGEWLLLGLGLTQIPALAAFLVAGFFFAVSWRQRRPLTRPLAFDGFQLLLLLWVFVALAGLYSAVEMGLLLRPDMQVQGNGSTETFLRFYVDRVDGFTPTARVVSLPLWLYRVAMLLWSLWLAARLVRWLAWTWRAFTQGGAWRPLAATKAAPPASGGGPAAEG